MKVLGRKVDLVSQQGESGFEQLFSSLLYEKTKNFIRKNRNITHPRKSGEIALCRCQQNLSLLKVFHKADVPPVTRVPGHG